MASIIDMKKRAAFRKVLMALAAIFLFAGAFLVGEGVQKILDNQQIRREYQNSSLSWKQELARGEQRAGLRDIRNQKLAENMQYVAIEPQIFFDQGLTPGYAGISNQADNEFWCRVTLIRDGTGETLYQSGLIEPGYYIEEIHLNGNLKKGYYPCTAVWTFYTKEEEYAGETAWKIVVIVTN